MNISFILLTLVYFVTINIYFTYTDSADPVETHTYRQCRCSSEGCQVNISCLSGSVQWIGLHAFGFGWFERKQDCNNDDNSSLLLAPEGDNCTKNLTTFETILGRLSGREKGHTFNISQFCPSSPDYFIAQFDCVPFKDRKAVEIDNECENYSSTSQSVSFYNRDFPNGINNTAVRSCDCNVSTGASQLVIQTYDNRLVPNQTLTLTHINGTVIKQWKKPVDTAEMLGSDTISVSNGELHLHWENMAPKAWTRIKGNFWIVIEASKHGGNITVTCRQNRSTTPSTMTTATSTMATSVTTRSNTSRENSTSAADSVSSASTSATTTTNIMTDTNASSFTQTVQTLTGINVSTSSSSYLNSSTDLNRPLTVSSTHAPSHITSIEPKTVAKEGPSSDGKSNLGTIIGVAVGGLFLLLLLILCCILCCCIKKKRAVEPVNSPQQPSNSRFKNEHNTNIKPGNTANKLQVDEAYETSRNTAEVKTASLSGQMLPPLPIGQLLNNVQTKVGLHDFNQSMNNEVSASFQSSNVGTNSMANDALYAKLIGDKFDENTFTSGEKSNMKGQTIGDYDNRDNIYGASVIHADLGENNDSGKKKKKKKKRRRNRIEALLDEDLTQDADKLHDNAETFEDFQ